MGNPNNVKGTASKLEALMNYQKQRKPERKRENLIEQIKDESPFSTLQGKEEDQKDTVQDLHQPTMQDFIEVIEDSNILQNKELSIQLLFLINCFVNMNCKTNSE
jgi:hypothetical protein